jgi:hypothetical protein
MSNKIYYFLEIKKFNNYLQVTFIIVEISNKRKQLNIQRPLQIRMGHIFNKNRYIEIQNQKQIIFSNHDI